MLCRIDSFDSSNRECVLTIRQGDLSIGKVHLIRGTWKIFDVNLVALPLFRFIDSIDSFEWLIFIDDPTSGVVYRKIAFHYSRGIDPGVNKHGMILERGIFMCL